MGCRKCRRLFCQSESEDGASSDSGSSSTESVHEIAQSDWYEEREFDSLFFAPGAFVPMSNRDMSNALVPEASESPAAMTQSMLVLATELPDADAPLSKEPILRKLLKGLTIESIKRRLEEDPFIFNCIAQKDHKAFDCRPGMWQEGQRIKGTQIRGFKFSMPLPDDIPGAVKRLITLPDHAMVRQLFRMRVDDDRLDMVQQTLTSGVPLGDNFRVQSELSFRPAQGGVEFCKWVDVIWVLDVPFHQKIAKGFVESKSKSGGKEEGEALADALLEECERS